MKRLIGLDLSLTATGVCTPGNLSITLKTKASEKERRLQVIRYAVRALLPDADAALIEGPGRFLGKVGHQIGEVHGIVKVELMEAGVPYVVVSPATLKKFATGDGSSRADKAAMILAAYKRSNGIMDFTLPGRDDNQCDAWWLKQAGLCRLGHPDALEMPKANMAALDAVDWTGWDE